MKLFRRRPKKIGLALGGGGARGLAHIHVLETLDEAGIRPSVISGTSIGAVVGALYASGLSGREIHDLVDRLLVRKTEKFTELLTRRDLLKWVEMIDPAFNRGALLKGEKFIRFLSESMECDSFEELEIPLHVVTANYKTGKEVVFTSGDLLSAVRASMAIPGVFAGVKKEGALLVDGGVVDPLPYGLLKKHCDVVIAVDVSGSLEKENGRPDFFEAVLGSFDIVQSALVDQHLKYDPPDIYLRPDLRNIRILEFNKAAQVFEQSASIKEALHRELKRKGLL